MKRVTETFFQVFVYTSLVWVVLALCFDIYMIITNWQ